MHELGVVVKFVETADAFAMEKGISQVKMVKLAIGAHTGVLPKYVRMYYRDVSEGTSLEGSELIIEEVPVEAFCNYCGCIYRPEQQGDHHHDSEMICPECGSEDFDLLSGEELTIKEIGFE
ncbi:MAG: hydrogenase maturation nickel metallochaperone HypA [Lentihominibacter sp.]|jgi:hydrogenase nickel incorporation protein HypA/HybF